MFCRLCVGFAARRKCDICLQQVLPSERSAILFLHGRFSVELGSLGATLPIITDEDIDNVFQRFISDSNVNNYVWLDAHAHDVDNDNSAQLHWINGKPSG